MSRSTTRPTRTTRSLLPAPPGAPALRHVVTRVRLALIALAIVLVAVGCSATSHPPELVADTSPVAHDIDTDADTPFEAVDEPGAAAPAPPHALVARPDGPVVALAAPDSDQVVAALDPFTEFGSARALLVVDSADGHHEVLLPVRPNGTTGWIDAASVEIRQVTLVIEVDLAQHRLVVTDGTEVVLESAVAVGAPATPTPVGTFAVIDKLQTPSPDSPYGPFALGLSGFSDVLTDFAGGDGQLGIHGTDDPQSIGHSVSNGCIRVPNEVVVVLSDLVPLGTPVIIR